MNSKVPAARPNGTETILRSGLLFALLLLLSPAAHLYAFGTLFGIPIQPALGAGVAGILIWGFRCWPALVLYNLVNGYACLYLGQVEVPARILVLGGLLYAGCGFLNTMLCAWSVSRWGRFGEQFTHFHEVARPVVFGALPLTLFALVLPVGMAWLGILQLQNIAHVTFITWRAEVLGLLLVLSLMSLWKSEMRGSGRSAKLAVLAPPLTLLALFLGLYISATNSRGAALAQTFHASADDAASAMTERLKAYRGALNTLRAFHKSSDSVTRQEFGTFVKTLREPDQLECVFAWIPRVTPQNRAAFESEVRADDNPTFKILSPNGATLDAQSEAYPLHHMDPPDGLRSPLGFDTASILDPSGWFPGTSTGEAQLLQQPSGMGFGQSGHGLIFLGPVFSTRNDVPASARLQGFHACFFQPQELIRATRSTDRDGHFFIGLYFRTQDGSFQLVTPTVSAPAGAQGPRLDSRNPRLPQALNHSLILESSGNFLRVDLRPTAAFYNSYQDSAPEQTLSAGILIAWLVGVVLLVLAGQNNRAEMLVTRRTLSLHAEIEERKRSDTERLQVIEDLEGALSDIQTLKGLLPICSGCKKIRDDQGYWTQIESYVAERSDAEFSHGICPDCAEELYPDYDLREED